MTDLTSEANTPDHTRCQMSCYSCVSTPDVAQKKIAETGTCGRAWMGETTRGVSYWWVRDRDVQAPPRTPPGFPPYGNPMLARCEVSGIAAPDEYSGSRGSGSIRFSPWGAFACRCAWWGIKVLSW